MVNVEIVFIALDKSLVQLKLSLKSGATVLDALNESGILTTMPETQGLPVGIFTKLVTADTVLKSGDRLEIYRPLTLDPREKRRQRAKVKKAS